MKETYCMKKSR